MFGLLALSKRETVEGKKMAGKLLVEVCADIDAFKLRKNLNQAGPTLMSSVKDKSKRGRQAVPGLPICERKAPIKRGSKEERSKKELLRGQAD